MVEIKFLPGLGEYGIWYRGRRGRATVTLGWWLSGFELVAEGA